MRALALTVISFAVGCAAAPKHYDLQRTEATVRVQVVERIPGRSNLYGLSSCREGICDVWIRRSVYPKCLIHELRHAFEDNFHAGRASTEDCL